ncbi:MAG TPA: S1 RNA-binding domain-containing protein [Spirochaetota bacterium]|nr:MAG: 30S ribosomal protein S1 [Spirochaetes bacterium ADurb.Bin133]HNZ26012.1 S1 RNA-binding domain-containing protein [Spirochaetota bacterium]HPY86843.1 S1 RNA-binding domain-containing protein [Spirochaetota bacterium]HQB61227.1 S1 RNA-binding domain-containing protein [Spirochaetota bacterium]
MSIETNDDELDFVKAYNESFKDIEENTLIEANVVQISSDTVFLDFGYKSEAKVPLSEFSEPPKLGDTVVVYLVWTEGKNGDPVVSKKKAETILQKQEIIDVMRDKSYVEGVVTGVKRNGFNVKYKSLTGLIPFSLFDVERIEDPNSFIGKTINFYIEKIFQNEGGSDRPRGRFNKNRETEDFMGNRRKYIYQEKNILRREFLDDKVEGEIIDGVVKNIADFGAFVDVGGIEALLHIRDISWSRIEKVGDVLKVGDKIKVMILKVNRTTGKVSVGLKQTEESPWDKFVEKYKVGDVIVGSVVSMTTYGAFVNIIDGLEGLLHISDMSWTKNIKNPQELLEKGQKVEVKIINIDEENRRVNLSLKHLLENPWDKAAQKYKVGTKVSGVVKNIVSFGLFVELEEGIDALLHIEDISWTEPVKNLHDLYKISDVIEGVVIQCDADKNKIKIGVKQLTGDPWQTIKDSFKKGDAIDVKIIEADDSKGITVSIVENVDSLIPISQLGVGKIDEIRSNFKFDFKVGETVKAMITELDPQKKIIKLSIKELLKKEEKSKVEAYLHNDTADDKYTLGDMLESKKSDK